MSGKNLSLRPARLIRSGLRWTVLGAVSGVLAGVASYVFLEGLHWVTDTQTSHRALVFFLPGAGLAIGLSNRFLAGGATRGNALLIDEIHSPTTWVPRRMAPLVLVGTWTTHLFGGSAGREGTALQMSGSLSDAVGRIVGLTAEDRKIMLSAALGGGFGSVFGVPFAGAIFALEVPTVGRLNLRAFLPALVSSFIGHTTVLALGYHHTDRPLLSGSISLMTALCLVVVGIGGGIAARGFVVATHLVRRTIVRLLPSPTFRPVIGACGVLILLSLTGRDYLGLSLPLLDAAIAGTSMALSVFALKIVFTAVTIGTGFPGGEVTPLFVIGGTLGAGLAPLLNLPVPLAAATGMVATFGAAANAPLACAVMGLELFGASAVLPIGIVCAAAALASGRPSIYESQRHHTVRVTTTSVN